jgi:predicted lipoprotein with Yx(FWY)xxD motif
MIKTKRLPLYVGVGALLSALAVVLGVTVSHAGGTGGQFSASPQSTVVSTRDTSLGQILVDAQGRTLYLFQNDTGPASTCNGSCASYWPPVPVTGQPHASGKAAATWIGVVSRSDGKRQLTYAGHPLYYYVGDSKAGQANGQGLNQFGARWYVLNPAGVAVLSAASDGNNAGTGAGGY